MAAAVRDDDPGRRVPSSSTRSTTCLRLDTSGSGGSGALEVRERRVPAVTVDDVRGKRSDADGRRPDRPGRREAESRAPARRRRTRRGTEPAAPCSSGAVRSAVSRARGTGGTPRTTSPHPIRRSRRAYPATTMHAFTADEPPRSRPPRSRPSSPPVPQPCVRREVRRDRGSRRPAALARAARSPGPASSEADAAIRSSR